MGNVFFLCVFFKSSGNQSKNVPLSTLPHLGTNDSRRRSVVLLVTAGDVYTECQRRPQSPLGYVATRSAQSPHSHSQAEQLFPRRCLRARWRAGQNACVQISFRPTGL